MAQQKAEFMRLLLQKEEEAVKARGELEEARRLIEMQAGRFAEKEKDMLLLRNSVASLENQMSMAQKATEASRTVEQEAYQSSMKIVQETAAKTAKEQENNMELAL